jgi:hypothetical protein
MKESEANVEYIIPWRFLARAKGWSILSGLLVRSPLSGKFTVIGLSLWLIFDIEITPDPNAGL